MNHTISQIYMLAIDYIVSLSAGHNHMWTQANTHHKEIIIPAKEFDRIPAISRADGLISYTLTHPVSVPCTAHSKNHEQNIHGFVWKFRKKNWARMRTSVCVRLSRGMKWVSACQSVFVRAHRWKIIDTPRAAFCPNATRVLPFDFCRSFAHYS